MFCKYCGKEIDDTAKFCKYCGKKVEKEAGPQVSRPASPGAGIKEEILHEQKRENLKKAIIGIAVAVVLFLAGALILGDSDEDIVKKGYFSFNHNVTVEKAFKDFFASPEWSSKEVNGVHYVYFKGNMANGQDSSKETAKVSFKVNPKKQTFEVIRMEIGGKEVTDPGEPLRQICEGRENIEYHTRSF